MSTAQLQAFESQFQQLSADDQRLLLERLAADQRRKQAARFQEELAAMAADPDIQREIRLIEREFTDTELDGLGSH